MITDMFGAKPLESPEELHETLQVKHQIAHITLYLICRIGN